MGKTFRYDEDYDGYVGESRGRPFKFSNSKNPDNRLDRIRARQEKAISEVSGLRPASKPFQSNHKD